MDKNILSEKSDCWIFHTIPQGLFWGLQLNCGIIPGVTLFDSIIDREGNPHLMLQTGRGLEYYYWTGLRWCAGKSPAITIFLSFHLAQIGQGSLQLLVVNPLGKDMEFSNYCLQEKGWEYLDTLVRPGDLKVEGFFKWHNDDLALIYTGSGSELGLCIYSRGTWRSAVEIEGKGRILDWFMDAQNLYLLFGKGSLPAGEVSVYTLSREYPQDVSLKAAGRIQGWDDKPFLLPFRVGEFKICWQSRGRINIARLQSHSLDLIDHVESDTLYPVEIRPLESINHPSRQIVLKTLCGIKLPFPVIMDASHLEAILQPKSFRGRGVRLSQIRKFIRKEWKQDRPGLSGRTFSPFVHSDSQVWPEQK